MEFLLNFTSSKGIIVDETIKGKYCRTLEEVAEYLNSSKVRKSKKAGEK